MSGRGFFWLGYGLLAGSLGCLVLGWLSLAAVLFLAAGASLIVMRVVG